MVVMSLLRGVRPGVGVANILKQSSDTPFTQMLVRNLRTSGLKGGSTDHHLKSLRVVPSRWQWQIYKDHLHFYLLLGILPACAVVFYANVFIGPATLCEIPEGYVPKQWEYYQSPVKRWFARYWVHNQQELYERNMHYITVGEEKRRMRLMAWKVDRLMRERGDYLNYYSDRTFLSKYVRGMQLEREFVDDVGGEF